MSTSRSPTPKHLKATYLAQGETLLRETLGTLLFYLPGPVLALLLALFFDYSALTVRFTALPAVPGVTWAFGQFPTVGQYAPANYLGFFFIAVTIVAVLWLGIRYARWISTVYAVTTSRVIVQRGILSRDFDQIPVLQVRGMDVHQSFADRIFGYGTIVISSEGGNRQTRIGNEAWKGIPRPFELQRIIETATQNLARNNSASAVVVPAPLAAPAAAPATPPDVRRPGAS
jgi:membrane protein YdbS with pleckstrin-like domain